MTPDGPNDWDDTDWDGTENDSSLDALDFDMPVRNDESGVEGLPDHYSDPGFDGAESLSAATEYRGYAFEEPEVDGFGTVEASAESEVDEPIPVIQTINPPGTVSVWAYLNGSIAQVDLDPKVATLTEPELADEIRFVAGVAAKRATAVLHGDAVNMLVEQGMDSRDARDFVETNMPYATPEQASEADRALTARHFDR